MTGRNFADHPDDTDVAPAVAVEATAAGTATPTGPGAPSAPQASAATSPGGAFPDNFADDKKQQTPSPNGDETPFDSDSDSQRGGHGSGAAKDHHGVFGLVVKTLTWTPRKLRYDPNNPPQFSLAHNFLYAFVSLPPFVFVKC